MKLGWSYRYSHGTWLSSGAPVSDRVIRRPRFSVRASANDERKSSLTSPSNSDENSLSAEVLRELHLGRLDAALAAARPADFEDEVLEFHVAERQLEPTERFTGWTGCHHAVGTGRQPSIDAQPELGVGGHETASRLVLGRIPARPMTNAPGRFSPWRLP